MVQLGISTPAGTTLNDLGQKFFRNLQKLDVFPQMWKFRLTGEGFKLITRIRMKHTGFRPSITGLCVPRHRYTPFYDVREIDRPEERH